MASYVEALEKKISELSGIALDQIRKNQYKNLADESAEIQASADLINSITVSKPANATIGEQHPLIAKTFELIQRESDEHAKAEGPIIQDGISNLPSVGYLAPTDDGEKTWGTLEPHLSADIMKTHYSKHHNGYVNNLNNARPKILEAEAAKNWSAYNALAGAVMFNGGSHLNHTIFWRNMQPNNGDSVPEPKDGALKDQINADFGSFDAFKAEFKSKTAAVKGSGWGWLAYDQSAKKLGVYTTGNQDTVEIVHGAVPILTCDVWEHAYYLQYKNLRASFIDHWFTLVNWQNAADRFANATK